MRSKLFYARARSMVVLPSYVAFEELPENSAAVVRVLLAKAVRTLRRRAEEGQPHCAQATTALSNILQREVICGGGEGGSGGGAWAGGSSVQPQGNPRQGLVAGRCDRRVVSSIPKL